MKIRWFVWLPLLSALLAVNRSDACSVAVVSGKCTRDGRPLLWKHRDTDHLQNALAYFSGGRYAFVGLINADDSLRESVWIGCNSAGFAIMNSQSYNLILRDTVKLKDREGIVMKMALERCATLADFERLLAELPKPLGVEANFGVIDAQGGAAFYEVDNFTYTKLDVNDPKIAPFGYLVHTNFSFTGDPDRGMGQIRFATAEQLFYRAYETGSITPRYLLQEGSRCLKHSLTNTDLAETGLTGMDETRFVPFEDYIPRFSTSASVVVQGVRPDESADLAVLWTVLGFPLSSIVTPVWLGGRAELPSLLTLSPQGVAPLCSKAMTLKQQLFPIRHSYGTRYVNLGRLVNAGGTGILQQLKPLDDRIFEEALKRQESWRSKGMSRTDLSVFYRWMEETIRSEYARLFGL